jgi:hypothetical protein
MPPKDITLGPGTVYFQTPEGPQPLGSITEATTIEAEEPEWAEDNPVAIKAAQEATFTAEVKISPKTRKAFTALGEACKQAAMALGVVVRAAADCAAIILSNAGALYSKAAKVQAALKEAPPRVRHLAEHSKKYRTAKKNTNRALREYRRRHKECR